MHSVIVVPDEMSAQASRYIILDSVRFDLDVDARLSSDRFEDRIEAGNWNVAR